MLFIGCRSFNVESLSKFNATTENAADSLLYIAEYKKGTDTARLPTARYEYTDSDEPSAET